MATDHFPANDPQPMTVAQLRALLEQTAQLASENARAIAEMRAANVERDARHDREMAEIRESAVEMRAEQRERAAQHDREMAEIRALQSENSRGLEELRTSQERMDRRFERLMESHRETRGRVSELSAEHDYTSNDVSTLKGWGMEFLCERRPGDFANALKLSSIELFPREKMFTMAIGAAQRGIVSGSSANDLHSGDVYFYGRRAEDDMPVYLIVQASFEVKRGDVKRASAQAETLETILGHDGPPEETGIALPVVAGTRLRTDPNTGAVMVALWDTTYVEISNGNELTA
ncbi:MAG: hypothetical protein OXF79_13310 [Chloroflexi bacterium]|nr:hypothetical protein [Chloroflexota bacterium]